MRPLAPGGRVMYAGSHPGLWAGIFLLLVVIVLVGGAFLIARMFVNRPPHVGRPDVPPPPPRSLPGETSALRILEERFARGEIDDDEFRQRRDILRS